LKRITLVSMLVLGLVSLGGTTALADPAGNNGTVKIDGTPFDQHPNNEPHVDCGFEVDFYGFDQGVGVATATFALHPPTGTNTLVTESIDIGEDAAGGGTDLDAELFVDLSDELAASGATPHPNQGFHVKLTVHAPGSIGNDVKHKVFWVECGYGASAVPVDQAGSNVAASFDSNGPLLVAILAAAALLGIGVVVIRRWRFAHV
jgi:hypothetical protein